jgi:hypothetical protein
VVIQRTIDTLATLVDVGILGAALDQLVEYRSAR